MSETAALNSEKIAFIGAGNMATAIIAGLLDGGYDPSHITASDLNADQLARLANDFGINTTEDNSQAVAQAEVVVLAVKPQVLAPVCRALAPALRHRPLIISIAAGIGCDSLSQWLGSEQAIVRCMPNTPSLVRVGASGLFANNRVVASQKVVAESVLSAVGLALWLADESQLHAVTAVSGSGPAYFFYVMEAMIKAGVEQGLPESVARQLTIETALGAATLAKAETVAPEVLRQRVTSPNGTTEQAVLSFDRDNLTEVVARAMQHCADRSQEMADELGR